MSGYTVGKGQAGRSAEYYSGYARGFAGDRLGCSDDYSIDYWQGHSDGFTDHHEQGAPGRDMVGLGRVII